MNVVDLFAGAGGLSVGFEQSGFNTILGVEMDENACNTYRYNISAPCIQNDLSERDELPVSENQVDIIAGGPPCQGFSINGKRDSEDERNTLVRDFYHYVDELSPEIVVMENVKGILSMENGDVINWIHKRLEELGYTSKHFVLSATDYGVPQNRNRVFVIGKKSGKINTPTPTKESVTIDDFLNNVNSSHTNHNSPQHQQKTIDRIANTKQGDPLYESYTQRIRLDPEDVAPTIVCGGPRPQWQLGHPTENRGLTVHERALLQTFPKDYVFKGGVVSGRVQTGNAVPPKLAKAVAESL